MRLFGRQADITVWSADLGPEIGGYDTISAPGGQEVTAVVRDGDPVGLIAAQQADGDAFGVLNIAAGVTGQSPKALEKSNVGGRSIANDDHTTLSWFFKGLKSP